MVRWFTISITPKLTRYRMCWRWSIKSKFPCKGITGCWTRLPWQQTQSFLSKRCERRKGQLRCTTTKELVIHFATSLVHKVQTPASIITLKLQASHIVEWLSFSSGVFRSASKPLSMNGRPNKVGRERRERVSQLARCGEGCFDSRRRVNSTVRRFLVEIYLRTRCNRVSYPYGRC